MPYTLEDFRRDYTRDHVDLLTPDERLQGLSLEEVLQRFSPEELQAYLAQRLREREHE
ncbi:MAG: hypothetical protein ETSY2_30810 [Candidatus Entotheonella gemina]|uniref:Uncharacterized protein n=1 Tax=Candidatus Entotheonella gemina TaxID=1429439 RepID=W4M172_9BACT|nr:MAG: hypothetical protein ETSY2_30810 [Candidatus Entotheonella gemina]